MYQPVRVGILRTSSRSLPTEATLRLLDSRGRLVRIWNTITDQLECLLKEASSSVVTSLAFSPDGMCFYRESFRMWDVMTGLSDPGHLLFQPMRSYRQEFSSDQRWMFGEFSWRVIG